MIDEYVDHIYVINLDSRKDRWKKCKKEFNYIGLDEEDYERFSAVNGHKHPKRNEVSIRDGALGCTLSHFQIYKDADERGFDKIAVFEDDVLFEQDFNERFEEYYKQLPDDWGFLYFGGNNNAQPKEYSENLKICTRTWATHSYLIGPEYRDLIKKGVLEDNFSQPVDNVFGNLQSKHTFYIFNPRITIQREDYSDVVTLERNYDHVLKEPGLSFRNKFE